MTYKEEVIKQTIAKLTEGKAQGHLGPKAVLGRLTELTCSCSGLLREVRFFFPPIPKPRHKNRRIRKKLVAKWMETNRIQTGILNMVSLMRPPTYQCVKCEQRQGFYAAMARNLIKVEPMPESSTFLFDYSKDPDAE